MHLLLKSTWNILQDRAHLGHKSNLSKFKKIEIISSIFSDHNAMRLDISYKKITLRNTNTWRLNNMFLNNQQGAEEMKREIKKFLETNDNENMTTQNLWDAAKAVLRGKFIAIQSNLKKQKLHQIDNLNLVKRNLKAIVKVNKTKSCFFKKINKIDKTLARCIKKKQR